MKYYEQDIIDFNQAKQEAKEFFPQDILDKLCNNDNPDHDLIARECKALRAVGVTVFAERGDNSLVRIRVRTFAPSEGVVEDPVCGSGNGAVTAFLVRHKHANEVTGSYLAEQGIEIGRDGEVHASWKHENDILRVCIGGEAVIVASGQLLF